MEIKTTMTTEQELIEFLQPITKHTIEELQDLMKVNCPQSIALRRLLAIINAAERDRAEYEKREGSDGKK